MKNLIVWSRVAVACVLAPGSVFGAWYAKFDGVDGSSQAAAYPGWCVVDSFSQGMHRDQTDLGTPRAARLEFEDFKIVKLLDKASPKLAEAVCNGKVFPKVEIHLTSGDTGGRAPQVYYSYELKNVQITSYQIGGSASGSDSVPTETLSLNFDSIKTVFREFDAAGREKGQVEFEWKVEEGES
jgi:type VI secretion system secreted protein Hcp